MGPNKVTKAQLLKELSDLRKQLAESREAQRSSGPPSRYDEQMYMAVVEGSNDGVAIVRGDKRLYCNRRYMELLGYAHPGELADKPLFYTVHPGDRERLTDYARRRQRGEDVPSRYELRLVKKDGSIIFVELSSTLIVYDGKPASLAFIRDITGRKMMEEELTQYRNHLEQVVAERTSMVEKSEKRYRDLVENALTGIYLSTPAGELLYVNDTLRSMLGYETREELLASGSLGCYKNPADRQALLDKLKKNGSFRSHEVELVTKAGQSLTALVSGTLEGDLISGMLMNVTEKKRAEQALRLSEERYRALLDNAGDPILVADTEGNFLEANKTAEALFGYTKEELLRMNIRQIHPEEELEAVTRSFREMIEGRLHMGRDMKVLKKDGTLVSVDITGNAVRYAGKVELQGIFRDITERKLFLEALKESEKRYRELVDNTDMGFVVFDESWNVLSANDPYVRMAGAEKMEELVGRSVTDWIAPAEKERNAKALSLCARQGYLQDFETVYQHRDGRRVNIHVNATMQAAPEGNQFVSLCRDITERKIATEKLRASEIKYRMLFEGANDGICLIEKGVFIECNERAHNMMGLSREEFLGGRLDEFSPPRQPDGAYSKKAVAKRLAAVLRGKPQSFEWRMNLPGGTFMDAELSLSRIIIDEETILVQAVVRDVTERKRTAEELKAKSLNLEEVNTALRVLLKQRDTDKDELEGKLLTNVKKLVLPYVEKLKSKHVDDEHKAYLNILETNLQNVISPFVQGMAHAYSDFTPTEIQVANLIKEGKTVKEIAALWRISENAVNHHRQRIRHKLGLNQKKTNLRTHILSLS